MTSMNSKAKINPKKADCSDLSIALTSNERHYR